MSRLYDNIKVLCKYKGVQIRDIEKPLRAGAISRYERRGTIMNLPIGLVHRASKLLDVPIEDLLEKDIANEIWGEKTSNEIYGIFKRSELSDELVEDLHKQVDLILEYAKKKIAEQTEPQKIDQVKADIEKRSSWSKTYEAMCKTENSSEKPNNCDTCRNKGVEGCEQPCLGCGCCGLYEPKDEPQTDIHDLTDCDFCKDRNCKDCEGGKDEPQTERSRR